MAGERINYDYITEYLHQILPETKGYLKQMEEFAYVNEVPVIHKEMKAFLEVLCKIKKPERILEIGSAIGYSASCMVLALDKKCQITTIERDSDMTELAVKNIEKLGLSEQIRVIEGDALEVLSCLTSKYDLIFIDAAKGYYNEFFEYAINLINDGGLIISDNVLYKGMTAEDSIVKRRQKTIVGRMREYLVMLCNHKNLSTSVIPIGDGVAVSIYNERGNNVEKT